MTVNPKLQQLLHKAESWPEELQEEVVDYLLAVDAEYREPAVLSAEDLEALERSAEDVRAGRFAKDEDARKLLRRYQI